MKIKSLDTPYIPLGEDLNIALDVLKTINTNIIEEDEKGTKSYKAIGDNFEIAVYETDGKVSSVWYNDPLGRGIPFGKKKKIDLYLQRYGKSKNWEKRMKNE